MTQRIASYARMNAPWSSASSKQSPTTTKPLAQLSHAQVQESPARDWLDFLVPEGVTYGAYRTEDEDHLYWRIAHFLFPF
jgi:hypothetical protein